MPTQSCLGYQLDDLYKADLAAEKAGQPGDYFVENFEQGGERALLCKAHMHIYRELASLYTDCDIPNSVLAIALAFLFHRRIQCVFDELGRSDHELQHKPVPADSRDAISQRECAGRMHMKQRKRPIHAHSLY